MNTYSLPCSFFRFGIYFLQITGKRESLMHPLKKIYCRMFQSVFRLVMPILPYREPKILTRTDEIIPILKENQITSVLLITGSHLHQTAAVLHLENELKRASIHCVTYDKTCANPTTDNVKTAVSLYQQENCNAIIAFGGGSPMDCAKATGACIAYPKKSISQLKGLLKVRKKLPTLFAIPTTAGTGSEVTITSVITDAKEKHKYTINSFPLIPAYAVLDPSVTFTLPPSLTATTGMDALTHAIESYIGGSVTNETRAYAVESVQLIFQYLEMAYADGKNEEARKQLLHASYIAGIAFSKSYVGYVHAIAHSLGGQYNVPHGLANAILLPIVLESYGACIYPKLHELAIAVGIATECDSAEFGAKQFIQAILNMNARMDIPKGFTCIETTDIPMMAEHADTEANPLYPVPKLMDAKELQEIYYRAILF